MRLDMLADVVAVLVRHDHVCNHNVRVRGFDLFQRDRGVMAGDNVNVFPAEGDLDYLTHGRTVVNEIDSGDRAHLKPPSPLSCADSSSSRSASSISSVAERSTVRVEALSPGRNL